MTEAESSESGGESGEYSGMTVADLRREIHTRIGVTGLARSRFTKLAMNSLAAYLTGDLPSTPSELYTDGGPDKTDMQKIVARQVLLEEWFDYYDHFSPRPFNKGELIDILEHMDTVGDQREWSGEATELGESHD